MLIEPSLFQSDKQKGIALRELLYCLMLQRRTVAVSETNKRQALIRNLESAVTDYALEQTKCPTCGSDLVQLPTNKHADGFEHEFGTEIFSIWGCQFCDNMVK